MDDLEKEFRVELFANNHDINANGIDYWIGITSEKLGDNLFFEDPFAHLLYLRGFEEVQVDDLKELSKLKRDLEGKD